MGSIQNHLWSPFNKKSVGFWVYPGKWLDSECEARGSGLSESKPSFLCQSPNLIIYQQLVEKTIVEIRFLATRSPKTHNTHTNAHTHTAHHARAHTHQPNWLKPKGVVTRTEHLHCGRRIWGLETVEENFLFD
jgi:hypothetical protein